MKHAVVQRMKAGQGDELELVSHRAELTLEPPDRGVIKFLFPVERRRAIVSKEFVRMVLVDTFGKALGFRQVWLAGFTPEQIHKRGVGDCAGDCLIDPGTHPIESLRGSLAGDERLVPLVDVTGQK